jgi:hypothetical protein
MNGECKEAVIHGKRPEEGKEKWRHVAFMS